ncbi:MAG: hypothetical protein HY619_06930 [Thaumarchaeota archaeon]|nr:hypothetical protein [Nitrososphaerota archaeon]
MTLACFLFTAHRPIHLNRGFLHGRVQWIVEGSSLLDKYFDEKMSAASFKEKSQKCYRPLFSLLSKLCATHNTAEKKFKFSFAPSGLFLEQAARYDPQLIETIKTLVASGSMEVLGCPYYSSLSSLYPGSSEFQQETNDQLNAANSLLGAKISTFANTDFIYNDLIGHYIGELGFKASVIEGDQRLGFPATRLYSPSSSPNVKLIPRHTYLSDILSRDSPESGEDLSLPTPAKYAELLTKTYGRIVLITLDLESIGGLVYRNMLTVLGGLPEEVSKHGGVVWSTPAEAAQLLPTEGKMLVPVPETVSKADNGAGISKWLGNHMQRITFERVTDLKPIVDEIGDKNVLRIWQTLQQGSVLQDMDEDTYNVNTSSRHQTAYSSSAEAYAVFDAIYTDFEGKIATVANRMKRSKAQPQTQTPPKTIHPPARSTIFTMQPPPSNDTLETIRY